MKLILLAPIVFACFVLGCHMAKAASFDCSKTGTAREALICATPQLSDDDSQLGEAYKEAMTTLPQDEADKLRRDERDWLKSLNQCPIGGDGSEAANCLEDSYFLRIRHVQALVIKNEMVTMVADPEGTESFFESHQASFPNSPNLAALGLALDLRLLLPNPDSHKQQIAGLLSSLVPWAINTYQPNHPPFNYDGSVKSLVPFIRAASLNPDNANPPIPCDLIVKNPILLDSTLGGYGEFIDSQMPVVACDHGEFQPGPAEHAYETLLGWNVNGEGKNGTTIFEYQLGITYQNWVVYLLPSSLLDTSKYDGENGTYLRQLHHEFARQIAMVPIDPDKTPLSASVYDNPDTYQSRNVLTLFPEARAELEKRYETLFGFSGPDAQLAAQRGMWLLQDAESWAQQGSPDPLAKSILTQTAVSAAQELQSFNPKSRLAPVYLTDAVLNPQVLAVLLRRHPDVNATCGSGITPLMEAVEHDELDSVKLLIAAGANVNAAVIGTSEPEAYNKCGGGLVGGWLNESGTTALMLATDGAKLEIIRQLVAAGADKRAEAQGEITALGHLELRLQVQKEFLFDDMWKQDNLPPLLDNEDAAEARRLVTP